jgi:hypothetical protein
MLRIEEAKFEHNRILVRLSDGRVEMRHLSNWPILFPLLKTDLENNQISHDMIVWPLLKFELNVAQILRAKKR